MELGACGLFALGIGSLCAFSASNSAVRARDGGASPRIDIAVRAAQRWAFVVCGIMMLASAVMTGPGLMRSVADVGQRDGGAMGAALHLYLQRDILAWKNVLHGGFLLAGFANFAQTGNPRYYTIALTLQCFVAAVVMVQAVGIVLRDDPTRSMYGLAGGAALFAAQAAHSALVAWRAFRLWRRGEGADSRAFPSLAATSKLARNALAVGDGSVLTRDVLRSAGMPWSVRRRAAEAEHRWRRAANGTLAAESALFLAAAASCIAVWTARWVAAPPADAALVAGRGELLFSLVQLYTSAVHQAWVLGNGLHGAASETSSVHALEAYAFAKIVLAPAALCSALAAGASLFGGGGDSRRPWGGEALPLSRFVCLAAYAAVQVAGCYVCVRLSKLLQARECDSNEANPLGGASAGLAAPGAVASPPTPGFAAALVSEGGVVSMRTLARERESGALHSETRRWAAWCVVFALLSGGLFQLEAVLLVATAPAAPPDAGRAERVGRWGGALSEALGFGLHGVAATFWALYRVPQQLCNAGGVIAMRAERSGTTLFARRKTYIGLGAVLFGWISGTQVLEALSVFGERAASFASLRAAASAPELGAVLLVAALNGCKTIAFSGIAVSYLFVAMRVARTPSSDAHVGATFDDESSADGDDSGADDDDSETDDDSAAGGLLQPVLTSASPLEEERAAAGGIQNAVRAWSERALRAYNRASASRNAVVLHERATAPRHIRLVGASLRSAAPSTSNQSVAFERLSARRAVGLWAAGTAVLAMLLGAAQVVRAAEPSPSPVATVAQGAAHLLHSGASDLSFHFCYIVLGYGIRGLGRGASPSITPLFIALVRMALGSFAVISGCALLRAAADGARAQQWSALGALRLVLIAFLLVSSKVSAIRLGALCRNAAQQGALSAQTEHALV
jgi:hypothetical protein